MFGDMTADIKATKKSSPIVTKLLLRGRKLNIPLVFISQSNSIMPKTIRVNETLFYNENSKQKRTSTNSFNSFFWH